MVPTQSDLRFLSGVQALVDARDANVCAMPEHVSPNGLHALSEANMLALQDELPDGPIRADCLQVVQLVHDAAQAAMDELNAMVADGRLVLPITEAQPNPYDPLTPDMPHKPDVSDV